MPTSADPFRLSGDGRYKAALEAIQEFSGWAVAHRTPIWNSSATLDLNSDLSTSSGIRFASSVPLLYGDNTVGAVTLHCLDRVEITIEQRLIVHEVDPRLAISVSVAFEHVLTLDATDIASREALYSVLETLRSHRRRLTHSSNSEAISVVQVTLGLTLAPASTDTRKSLIH